MTKKLGTDGKQFHEEFPTLSEALMEAQLVSKQNKQTKHHVQIITADKWICTKDFETEPTEEIIKTVLTRSNGIIEFRHYKKTFEAVAEETEDIIHKIYIFAEIV